MAKSRLSKRREAEAAEAMEAEAPKKKSTKKKTTKKKAAKKKTTRSRKKASDVPARRRLVWVVYSSTMREEGRYLYHERDKAEEKLNALLAKGKRRYFIQPIKEPLDSEGNPLVPMEDEAPAKAKPAPEPAEETDAEAETDAEGEVDAEADGDDAEIDDDVPEIAGDDDE